jgi:hypothetical protein
VSTPSGGGAFAPNPTVRIGPPVVPSAAAADPEPEPTDQDLEEPGHGVD